MVPVTALVSPKSAALTRAFNRAAAERLIAFPNADGTWACKSYTLIITGAHADDVRCDCVAGRRGLTCKHSACVTFCRKYRVRPIRPSKPAPTVCPRCGMATADPLHTAYCG